MRSISVLVIVAALLCGCAGDPVAPGMRGTDESAPALLTQTADTWEGPYRLWGEWTFFIDETHEKIDVVPRRTARFHLNVLKFLEDYCTNCLQITQIKNNGDGTIDLTVRIVHPFPGYPEYTGFDVKGIIMFDGSYEYPNSCDAAPYPEMYVISWRLLGDPELLNPDGWTVRWSPSWVSGSDQPVFNYWPGRYSNGTPMANLNGFRNFYSNEQRHMFATNSAVQRVYTIWLPPGQPVVAGYAVEACWAPPIHTPVTDPLTDFPPEANQPEPYLFNYVVNDNQPITESPCCGNDPYDCSGLRAELARWDGVIPGFSGNTYVYRMFPNDDYFGQGPVLECSPPQEDAYWMIGSDFTMNGENGIYRQIARYCQPPTLYPTCVALDVFDFVVEID